MCLLPRRGQSVAFSAEAESGVTALGWMGPLLSPPVGTPRLRCQRQCTAMYGVRFEFCRVMDYIGWHRRAYVLRRCDLVSGRV
jgi:hypothetical protein